ncbi:protein halfway isoform X2 [Phymastichus coffea]|uniref:protein halfway isoform X2 n=1 Tax=Phymastichus coffea TaxID=108790 RepID=UPI00273C9458|nr:protein halfway isoform X2 [Phymastichus coffea]
MTNRNSFKIRWFTAIMYLYVVSARTEEDQSMTANAHESLVVANNNQMPEKCFYRGPSECPPAGANPCKRITLSNVGTENVAVFCCNLTNHTEFESALARVNFPSNVSYIHIRNATLNYVNTNEVRWRMLKSLAITDGRISRIKGQFLIMTPMVCLNLSNNALLEMENSSLIRLSQLTTLDLSYNNLTHLPTLNIMNGREFWLDICGTNTLLCHDIQQNVNKTGENQIIFNRENETLCSTKKNWHWFNSTEEIPLKSVRYISSLQSECPKGENWHCICEFDRLEFLPDTMPTMAVNVDCSNNQLTQLPKKLPRNTVKLNVSYNNITTLDELYTNPNYDDLREFTADYNNISSINTLEGSKFLDSFAFLSLRHNKIKSLPTYILASNFDKSYSTSRYGIRFGGNELHCDCNTAKFLKIWLQTRITDPDEVLCENVKEKVIDLEPSKMCVYPGDWTDYIYYIIATEVLLLIGLIAKVSYDYWVFKTAGYLPWPANKMPKLPCDWLCET